MFHSFYAEPVTTITTTATDSVRVPEDCKTLKEAVERVHGDDGLTTIVVGKGKHQIDGKYLYIASAMNIVGEPGVLNREDIVVVGGIWFEEGIQGNSHLQHLIVRQAKGHGVIGFSSFTMEDVLVEQCGGHGVVAYGTGVVGRCTNVEVRQCRWSGVKAYNGASITLIGAKTTVHHNCTKGGSHHHGLAVWGSSATIQLVSPLTKEQVSLDNGGGNWGAGEGGDINQIKTISNKTYIEKKRMEITQRVKKLQAAAREKAARKTTRKTTRKAARRKAARKAMRERVAEMSATSIRVPEDYRTLKEAVERVHDDNRHDDNRLTNDRLTTIIVGKGQHQIDGMYLDIPSAMNIVGDPGEGEWVPKSEIVIRGGVQFAEGIQGICHLQHLTLHGAKGHGVLGWSSFTMEDVLVKRCGWSGVCAYGPDVVARCTDVEVRKCGRNGVRAYNGASITLIGRTTVHHNCKRGDIICYGLKALSGTIKLVSFTKDQVSYDNNGGGNWNTQFNDNIEEKNMNQTLANESNKQLTENERFPPQLMELVPNEYTDFKLRF